jgi:hypothetical protein
VGVLPLRKPFAIKEQKNNPAVFLFQPVWYDQGHMGMVE